MAMRLEGMLELSASGSDVARFKALEWLEEKASSLATYEGEVEPMFFRVIHDDGSVEEVQG